MKKLLLLLCLSVPAWAQIINGGGGGATPAGTSGQIQINNGASGLGASTVTADGSGNLVVPGTSTIAGSESVAGSLFVGAGTPNEGTTGTDLNGTAEFVNTGGVVQLKACATSKRYCFLVVKESSCGGGTGCTTGNAWVQGAFTETDTFSNTAVVGNWFKGSTTAAKQIEDTGTANTLQCPVGITCLGFAMTAGSGAQTVVRMAPVVGTGSNSSGQITTLASVTVATGTNKWISYGVSAGFSCASAATCAGVESGTATYSNFRGINSDVAVPSGGTLIFVLQKNGTDCGSPGAVTLTWLASASLNTIQTDATNTCTVAAGDSLTWHATNNSSGNSPKIIITNSRQ